MTAGAEGIDVSLLTDNGADMHSYQPTVDDIISITDSDIMIYVGGESDGWIDDALAGASDPDRMVIRLMDIMGERILEEEIVPGMQEEQSRTDLISMIKESTAGGISSGAPGDQAPGSTDDDEEYDEHVWLSLRNAELFCGAIAEALRDADPAGAALYTDNAASYILQLKELDSEYAAAVSASALKTLLFADRFPFRYLTQDYGLTYYAAFPGCSAESDAGFETVIYLAERADELGLKYLLIIDGSDSALARTIISCTSSKDQSVLELDSMQSVSAGDIAKGAAYTDIMRKNLGVLRKALGAG